MVNFRTFYGEHKIVFSNESNKNVTLVHAENSTGKTTMLNALKWCFYAKTPDFDIEIIEFPPDVRLANLDLMEEGSGDFEVEVEFEHDGIQYRVNRSANQRHMKGTSIEKGKDSFSLFEVQKHGNNELLPEPRSAINKILPEELSDYFLFSGESVEKKLTNQGLGYKNAVRDILGFALSDIAITDLNQLRSKNTTKKHQLLRANSLTESAGKELQKLTGDLDIIKDQIAKMNDDLDELIIQDELCTQKIQDSKHDVAQNEIKQRREKEKSSEKEILRRDGFLKEKIDLINQYGFAIFGALSISNSNKLDFLKGENFRGKIPAAYQDSFVSEVLDSGVCICDRKFKKNSHEYDSIKSLIDTANTALINERVQKAFSISDHFKGRASNFISELGRITKAIAASNKIIKGYDDAIVDHDARLEALGSVDISQTLADQRTIRKAKQEQENAIAVKNIILNNKKSEIGDHNKNIEKIKTNNPELELRNEIDRVTNIIIHRLQRNQKLYEDKARNNITANVQRNMDAYLRKEFKSSLDEDYNLSQTYVGTKVRAAGTGKGQKLLTKLSFVTALIAHSKGRVEKGNSWASSGTIAPFVIDAPFAQMDVKYQKAALNFLPNQSHQLILFLSSGQWRDEYEKIIGKKIGKRYYIENHVPKNSNIDDEDLTVKGVTYELLYRDWDKKFPTSILKEIK